MNRSTPLFITLFLYSLTVNAQSLATEDVLEELPSSKDKISKSQDFSKLENETPKISKPKQRVSSSTAKLSSSSNSHQEDNLNGNLPAYARRSRDAYEFEIPTTVPKNSDFDKNSDIKPGDVLKAVINHNIVAYAGSKSPVTAHVLEGNFKGATILGEAFLDASTKRINVTFKTIRPMKGKDPYSFTGILLAEDGMMGIEGRYESNYWNYFWAEALSNTVAGFADATTKKSQNIWGSNTPDPGLDPSARQGISHSFARTADRIAEKGRNAPETATVTAPTIIQITVTN